jgi:hypothetical protein
VPFLNDRKYRQPYGALYPDAPLAAELVTFAYLTDQRGVS